MTHLFQHKKCFNFAYQKVHDTESCHHLQVVQNALNHKHKNFVYISVSFIDQIVSVCPLGVHYRADFRSICHYGQRQHISGNAAAASPCGAGEAA